jgi:Tol biopolymer transport system component
MLSVRQKVEILLCLCILCVGCTRTDRSPNASPPPPAPAAGSSLRLTPDEPWALYEHPAWSPDGGRLAFSEWWIAYHVNGGSSRSRTRLLVIERKGTTPRVVWDSGEADRYRRIEQIQWSADGQRLLFSETLGPFDSDDIRYHTRLVTPAGEVQREIRSPSFVSWDWSRDGEWIVFTALQGPVGDPKAAPGLWVTRLDGRELRQLLPVNEDAAWLDGPAWSPDGESVAFFFVEQGSPHRRWLRSVDRSGTEQSYWHGSSDQNQHRVGPAWSSEGARLFAAVGQTLITAAVKQPEATKTRLMTERIAAIAPDAGVFASFVDGNLRLAALDGSAINPVTRDGRFKGRLGAPRLGNWPLDDGPAAEVAIARDRAVAVTADRALHRFLPPFR